MIRRKLLAGAAAGLVLPLTFPTSVFAQANNKVARLIVPFPAGGGTDAVARMTAEKMRPEYPAGLIVENRAGASGRLGAEYVQASEADGMTLLFTPDFVMTIFPYSFKKLSYAPQQDFAPVALCSKTGYALVAGPGLPASVTNLQQFVAWAKANPKQAAFASTSAGSASHFGGIMLSRAIGAELLHVPYKGGALALQDVMGGQVPISINPIGEVLPHMKTGRVRVLATTGAQRSRFMPDAPTLVEAGLKDMVVESWLGVLAPGKTPAATIAKTSATINAVLQRQDIKDGYAGIGMETVQSTPASFAAVIKADMERWAPIVKASGFTAEE
ncbi:MAG: tripartite tricarboxylate transporter substrate-binding protein [Pseudomonadota bacterium]